jgi:hypothetical protein
MADASVRRRERGEDAIDFVVARNRYIGASRFGLGPDTKQLRPEGLGQD